MQDKGVRIVVTFRKKGGDQCRSKRRERDSNFWAFHIV